MIALQEVGWEHRNISGWFLLAEQGSRLGFGPRFGQDRHHRGDSHHRHPLPGHALYSAHSA